MRGDDVQQEAMFSYLSPKLECPGSSAPADPEMVIKPWPNSTESSRPCILRRDALPFPGEAAARLVAASLLHHPQRPDC